MNKSIESIAEQFIDEGQVADCNKDVPHNPWVYSQASTRELKFADELAYDPRLHVSGIVYGD